jgi:hypothetical protein
VQQFSRHVLTEMSRLPGVQFAAAAAPLSLPRGPDEMGHCRSRLGPGSTEQRPNVSVHAVSADYFRALQILWCAALFRRAGCGRQCGGYQRKDCARFWPNAEPVGQSLKLGGRNSPGPWLTVVGVAKTARGHTWYEPTSDVWDIYVPFDAPVQTGTSFPWLNFYVRTAADATPLFEPIRKAIWAVDKEQPILAMRTMEEWLHQAGLTRRALAMAERLRRPRSRGRWYFRRLLRRQRTWGGTAWRWVRSEATSSE